MIACPQCGTVPKPSDKFCNTCGTPVVQPAPAAFGQQPAYAGGGGFGTGAQPPNYGAPSRCQMGHDVAPGQSYCAQGHPIALDAMQFPGGEPYGQPQQQAYGGQPYGGPQQAYPQQSPQPPYGQPGPPYAPGGQVPGGFPPPNMYGPGGGGFGPPPPFDGPAAPAPQPAAPPPAAQAISVPANALRGFLVAYQANNKGEFWPLNGGRMTVGRSSTGDQLDIPLADATISSRHALLVVDGSTGTITVEDTGSTNGTYVNEEHLGFNGRRELRDGDRVRFGGFTTIIKVIGRI
jgi:hypothetical protein